VDADVVFCCTSAPHFLLTKQLLFPLIALRRNQNDLLVIDVSNPRNVEENIREIPHVKLYDIDDLTAMAENNKQEREKIMWEAFRVVDRELEALECAINADSVNEIVAEVLSQVEENRRRELAKALGMIGELDERKRKVVSDLTSILMKKTFLPVIENFRRAAANNDLELVNAGIKIFDIK